MGKEREVGGLLSFVSDAAIGVSSHGFYGADRSRSSSPLLLLLRRCSLISVRCLVLILATRIEVNWR